MGNIGKSGTGAGGCWKFAYPDVMGCTGRAAASLEVVLCCLQRSGLQQDCLHKMSLTEMFLQDDFSSSIASKAFPAQTFLF